MYFSFFFLLVFVALLAKLPLIIYQLCLIRSAWLAELSYTNEQEQMSKMHLFFSPHPKCQANNDIVLLACPFYWWVVQNDSHNICFCKDLLALPTCAQMSSWTANICRTKSKHTLLDTKPSVVFFCFVPGLGKRDRNRRSSILLILFAEIFSPYKIDWHFNGTPMSLIKPLSCSLDNDKNGKE